MIERILMLDIGAGVKLLRIEGDKLVNQKKRSLEKNLDDNDATTYYYYDEFLRVKERLGSSFVNCTFIKIVLAERLNQSSSSFVICILLD